MIVIKEEKKRYHISVCEEVMREFKHLCLDEGVSVSEMIEGLIMKKLKEKK